MKRNFRFILNLVLVLTIFNTRAWAHNKIEISLEREIDCLEPGKIAEIPIKLVSHGQESNGLELKLYNNKQKVIQNLKLSKIDEPVFRIKIPKETSKLSIYAVDNLGKQSSNRLDLYNKNLGIVNKRERIVQVLDYEEEVELGEKVYIPEWINVRTNIGKTRKVATINSNKIIDTSKKGIIKEDIRIPFSNLKGKYTLKIEEPIKIGDKDPIGVKDEDLEKAIRSLTGKSKGEILKEDVKNIKEFVPIKFKVYEIKDISGLEHFESLEVLDLDLMQVSDISPIKNLKNLRWLYLSNNPINKLEKGSFKNLKKLEQLGLEGCGLTYIKKGDLKGLDSLHYIDLTNNNLIDIEGIEDLQALRSLHLDDNRISDLKPIENLKNLEILWIDGNGFTDASPIFKLYNLEWLRLSRNFLTNLNGIENLTSLKKLEFNQNNIKALPNLSKLKNLEEIKGCSNKLENLKGLEGLDKIKSIEFISNELTDISSLKNLTSLKKIDLSKNKIKDLTSLSKLIDLSHLWIKNNKIENLKGLENLQNLQLLMIKEGNIIQDFSPVLPYYFGLKYKDFTI